MLDRILQLISFPSFHVKCRVGSGRVSACGGSGFAGGGGGRVSVDVFSRHYETAIDVYGMTCAMLSSLSYSSFARAIRDLMLITIMQWTAFPFEFRRDDDINCFTRSFLVNATLSKIAIKAQTLILAVFISNFTISFSHFLPTGKCRI